MVGDARRDVEAAAAAGARPVLVLTGKGAKTQSEGKLPSGYRGVSDLARSSRTSSHDRPAALDGIRRRAPGSSPRLTRCRARHVPAAAHGALPHHLGLVALRAFPSKIILGIEWRVEGRENLPSRPAVILAKHQSAWRRSPSSTSSRRRCTC